jgi:hypothetical protein
MMDTPLFQVQSPYDLPKLMLLPLREQPAYRVAQSADSAFSLDLQGILDFIQSHDVMAKQAADQGSRSFSQVPGNSPAASDEAGNDAIPSPH